MPARDPCSSHAALASSAARVRSLAHLGDWLRGAVREAIPHRAAFVSHGSAHSLGFSIEQRIRIDLPESYIAAISTPSGQIRSPLLERWMRTREIQYFEPGCAAPDIDPMWLRNFSAHALRNCALCGLVDDALHRVTFLVLYDVPERAAGPESDLHRAAVALLQSALVRIDDAGRRDAETPRMTPAELEVLRWLGLGRTNNEIGLILGRSPLTVKTHVQRMLAKTGLDNRTQLSDLARRGMESRIEI